MRSVRLSAANGPMGWNTLAVIVLSLGTVLVVGDNLSAQPTLKEVLETTSKGEEEGGESPVKSVAPQEVKTESTKPEIVKAKIPVDELNRGVPRTTVQGFLDAAHERDFDLASQYLDLRNLPKGMEKNAGLRARP